MMHAIEAYVQPIKVEADCERGSSSQKVHVLNKDGNNGKNKTKQLAYVR